MIEASNITREEKVLDYVDAGYKTHIAKIEYIDDDETRKNLADIRNFSISKSTQNNQVNAFSFLPPAGSLSLSFSNKNQKYNPENTTSEFNDLMRRGRQMIPQLGFKCDERSSVLLDEVVNTYSEVYYAELDSGEYRPAALNPAAIVPNLPGVPGAEYGAAGSKYGDIEYTWCSYLLTDKIEFSSNGTKRIKSIEVTANTNDIQVWYRHGNHLETFDENIFTYAGNSLADAEYRISIQGGYIESKYFQVLLIFNVDTFDDPARINENIKINYYDLAEYFEYGIYEADDPSFSVGLASQSGNISGRDFIKKIYDQKISTPAYSGDDVCQVIRDIFDRCGVIATTATIPDSGLTVTVNSDDTFKNIAAYDALEECMQYLNALNTAGKIYTLAINNEGEATLLEKPLNFVTPQLQFDYRLNVNRLQRTLDSNNFLQRATVSNGSPSVSEEIELHDQNIAVSTPATVVFSHPAGPSGFTDEAINLRLKITGTGKDTVTYLVTDQSLDSISIQFSADAVVNINIKIFGTYLSNSRTEYVGEKINADNAYKSIGTTQKFENRFLSSDADCKAVAELIENNFAAQKWRFSLTVRYNPLVELGDKITVYEQFTETQSLMVAESITYKHDANSARTEMNIDMLDISSDFQNIGWDRHNIINGGSSEGIDDLEWDVGFIWDGDLDSEVTEDTTDYSSLKQIEVGN